MNIFGVCFVDRHVSSIDGKVVGIVKTGVTIVLSRLERSYLVPLDRSDVCTRSCATTTTLTSSSRAMLIDIIQKGLEDLGLPWTEGALISRQPCHLVPFRFPPDAKLFSPPDPVEVVKSRFSLQK